MATRLLLESPDEVILDKKRLNVFTSGAVPFMKIDGKYVRGAEGGFHEDMYYDFGIYVQDEVLLNGEKISVTGHGRLWVLDNSRQWKFKGREVDNIISFWIGEGYINGIDFIDDDPAVIAKESAEVIKTFNLNPHTTLVEVGDGLDEEYEFADNLNKIKSVQANSDQFLDHLMPGDRLGPKDAAGSIAQGKKAEQGGFESFAQYYYNTRQGD